MGSPLNKKMMRFALSLAVALFGPFILPPHVVGIYDPLVSLLLSSDVWSGEADGAFYVIFCVEWGVYSLLVYYFSGVMLKLKRKDG